MIPFLCLVLSIHDGDTLTCADRTRIRVAGIQAPDYQDTAPCRRHAANYTCDNARARASQRIVSRLTLHRTLTCVPVGRSYARVVAVCQLPGGTDLACAIVRLGAADWWPAYVRRYRLGRCGR